MGLEMIQKLKKEKGLTTEMISKLSGVPIGTLNKILNGETKDPKLETLKAIARVLGCTLDDFDDVEKDKSVLTEKESMLLVNFRKLTEENQSKILMAISGMLAAQEIDGYITLAEEKGRNADTA